VLVIERRSKFAPPLGRTAPDFEGARCPELVSWGRARAAAVPGSVHLVGGAAVTTRQPPIKSFPTWTASPQASGGERILRRQPRQPQRWRTVAIGQLREDYAFETGISSGMYAGRNPLPIDAALLARGRERYDIYCAVCHDRTGSGRGIVPLRVPSWQPTNLLDERIRKMSDGELFSVSSDGRRTMHGYRFQSQPGDCGGVGAAAHTEALWPDVPPDSPAVVSRWKNVVHE
jgi:mono/diheme cytochrome c family protein